MPNRIIKESICTSENLNELSPEEEVFFYRILVNCDDYGRLDARTTVLRSKCFPLKIDEVSGEKIKSWLNYLESKDLLFQYKIDDSPFLQIVKWEKHQEIRTHRSKYPAPPDGFIAPRENIYPDERDIEDLFYDYLSIQESFNGESIVSLSRQVRVKESYLDIVLKTPNNNYIFELKRNRLSNKSIQQLTGYLKLSMGLGLLVGCGLAVNFDVQLCIDSDIAVLSYDNEEFEITIINKPAWLVECDLTLSNVKQRQTMLALNPIQSESESESNTCIVIFNFWNEQKIIVHKKINDGMKKSINKALKDYSTEEICHSIKNYAEILNGSQYYFKYKWTLADFLQRGLDKFIDLDVARNNYRRDKDGTHKPRPRKIPERGKYTRPEDL